VGAGVIFVDTLAAAFPGLVENEAGPMGGAVRSLTGLGEATDAAVVAVHHTPKSGDTPRGHSALNAAADVTLRVEGEGGGARAVRMGKNRNGASDAALGFRLRLVDLGHDAEGDPIVKPIAEELDGAAGPERPALTEAERRALDMLASAIVVEGTALPRGSLFPTGLRGVPERRWREECATRRLSPTDTAEAQRKAFDRAFKALLEKRVVAARDDLVWIARHPADGHGQKTDTSEPVRPGNPGGATDGHGHPPKGCPVRPARRSPEREAGAQRGR
jgi:hypothetical protein